MNKVVQTIIDAQRKDRHRGMIVHYNDRFLGLTRIHLFKESTVRIDWGTGDVIFCNVLVRYTRGGHTSSYTSGRLSIKQKQICEKQPWN